MNKETELSVGRRLSVWILRVMSGCTFVFSGFVKIIDPWGFIYKLNEYFSVWAIDVPDEIVLCMAISVASLELVCGILLATGCMRRFAVISLAAMMSVMLPLTLYIAIASPVADCGCFGDVLVISNTATFVKNIIISLSIVYLIIYNHKVKGVFKPRFQWLVITASVCYCIAVGAIGYYYQPLLDFRPYKVGTAFMDDQDDDVRMIYTKDGLVRSFSVYDLPDSTWTYVDRQDEIAKTSSLSIFDGDEDVTADVISAKGKQLILIVSDPELHNISRSEMANRLNGYMDSHGGSMIGIIATTDEGLYHWSELAKPDYDVFTADDTTLKEIARGNAALIYIVDGKIVWKRNMYSFPPDFPYDDAGDSLLDDITAVDSGYHISIMSICLIIILVLVYALDRILPAEEKLNKKPVEVLN